MRMRAARIVRLFALAIAFGCGAHGAARAQMPGPPKVHYLSDDNTPGLIGARGMPQGGPVECIFQPIELKAPPGTVVAVAADGQFLPLEPAPVRFGLAVAPVYRFRVANIPGYEGREVYPSVEVISRLHPPAGKAWEFPIPIDLTEDDLELALNGKFVTRVVYLEDSRKALPVQETRDSGRWFDAGPGANPVQVADEIGRPMAIVRIGGRQPSPNGDDPSFYGSGAPLMKFPARQPQEIERSPYGPRTLPMENVPAQPGQPGAPNEAPNAAPQEAQQTAAWRMFDPSRGPVGQRPQISTRSLR